MADETDVKPQRARMSPLFIWIPVIFSFLFALTFIIIKLSEKVKDSFLSWTWVVASIFVCLFIALGLSMGVYLMTSLRSHKPSEKVYHDRAFCDQTIKREIRDQTGLNLSGFIKSGDSIKGVGWYGSGNRKDLIYYQLYRIHYGSRMRYLLAVMNMEAGQEDKITVVQSPMNFSNLNETIEGIANRLTPYPEHVVEKEKIFTDELSGRSRVEREKTPFEEEEEEEEEA